MKNSPSNSSQIKSQLRHKFILIVFLVLPLFFADANTTVIFGQIKNNKEKEISRTTFENEPIEFLEIEADGKIVKLNEKFTQENVWLKDLTINFKNISDKLIVYIAVAVDFPETDVTGDRMLHVLKYGAHPLAPPMPSDKKELLVPGGTSQIRLSSEEFTTLKNFLSQRHLLANLTKANFRIMSVYFADGTNWFAGANFRPDPDRPGKFIPVCKKHLDI